MKTIKNLEEKYKKETSLYKKVYIYVALQKLRKRNSKELLEQDILDMMEGDKNERNSNMSTL